MEKAALDEKKSAQEIFLDVEKSITEVLYNSEFINSTFF